MLKGLKIRFRSLTFIQNCIYLGKFALLPSLKLAEQVSDTQYISGTQLDLFLVEGHLSPPVKNAAATSVDNKLPLRPRKKLGANAILAQESKPELMPWIEGAPSLEELWKCYKDYPKGIGVFNDELFHNFGINEGEIKMARDHDVLPMGLSNQKKMQKGVLRTFPPYLPWLIRMIRHLKEQNISMEKIGNSRAWQCLLINLKTRWSLSDLMGETQEHLKERAAACYKAMGEAEDGTYEGGMDKGLKKDELMAALKEEDIGAGIVNRYIKENIIPHANISLRKKEERGQIAYSNYVVWLAYQARQIELSNNPQQTKLLSSELWKDLLALLEYRQQVEHILSQCKEEGEARISPLLIRTNDLIENIFKTIRQKYNYFLTRMPESVAAYFPLSQERVTVVSQRGSVAEADELL